MSDVEDFIISVASQLLETLEPLARLAQSESEFADVLTTLGWPAQPGADLSGVREPFDIGNVLSDIRWTIAKGDLEDPAVVLAAASSISDVVTLVQALTGGPPNRATLPSPFNTAAFWSTFPTQLFEQLLINRLERAQPAITALVALVGVIDEYEVAAAPPRTGYRARVLDLGKLASFLADPLDHMKTELGWGDGRTLDQDRVLTRLSRLVSLLGPARIAPPREGAETPYWSPTAPVRLTLRELTGTLFEAYNAASQTFGAIDVAVLPIPARNTPTGNPVGVAIEIDASAGGAVSTSFDLGPVVLAVEGALQVQGGIVVDLRPDSIDTRLTGVAATLDAALALKRTVPLVLIGSPNGIRVELGAFEFRVAMSGDPADLEFVVGINVQKLAFIIQASSADSFLGSFLGTDPQSVTLDLEIVWSSKKGVRLSAGGGFRFVIQAHLDLSFLTIDTITIELIASTQQSAIVLNLAVDVVLALGPVTVTVTQVGARALATPRGANDPPGNLGPLDLGFGFKPPTGASLLVEASVVTGGGYALFDWEKGEYAGILQLTIQDYLSITAIGLISTQMPDGSKGFSLLVILTAEFPPIQLGYGFTLSGLGGIFGLNRTLAVDALRDGARNGALDSILFPIDPLKHVPKVISDVQTIFPVAPGRFVIGLMARIGWGAQIITVDLGIVIDIPSPIVIALLGRVMLVLPEANDDAVVFLKLDVVGIIDIGRGEISIDATLRDSRLAMFAITGDMAARFGWGATKIFAISAGGFNPRFPTPNGFPELHRLGITLATTDNPLVRLETYLALTSNSAQIGAHIDISAKLDAGALGVFSAAAYLGFDVLIIFNPFGFAADISGGAEIKRNGRSFASATLVITITGPAPWHASGYAEVDFIGKHRIPIDVTMGDPPPPTPPKLVNPTADLLAALADKRNWMAQLPVSTAVVTLRQFESADVLAHPLGTIGVRQRIVPFGVHIDLYGGAPVEAAGSRFDLAFAVGSISVDSTRQPVRDDLAPGQFFALSDDEKLSRPAFEPMLCGYSDIGVPPLKSGPAVDGSDQYITRVVDEAKTVPAPSYAIPQNIVGILSATGAAARSPSLPKYRGPSLGIKVTAQTYRVASTTDMQATPGEDASYVEADERRRAAGGLTQVVGSHEVTG
jgi:hypothetical protein